MADISKIVLGGTIYNIKDSVARATLAGGMHFLGVSMTNITDDSTLEAIVKTGTNTANKYYTGTPSSGTSVTIGGVTYTTTNVPLTSGDVVIYGRLEFVFSGSDNKWHELGSTGSLGTLAYKSNIAVTYKKATSASFSGTAATITHSVTQGSVTASGDFTPSGTISGTVSNGTPGKTTMVRTVSTSKLAQTTIHDTPKLNTTSIDTVGTISTITPSTGSIYGCGNNTTAINASYANETLTLSAVSVATKNSSATTVVTSAPTVVTAVGKVAKAVGTSITAGTAVTVATGAVASTGTGSTVATGVPSDGYADSITSLGTPTFTGTFTGTQETVYVGGKTSGVAVASHSYTPAGSVIVTNTDTAATVSVS